MIHWLFTAVVSYTILTAPAYASPRTEIFRHAKNATVLIIAVNDSSQSVSMGSGFFLNEDGLIVTNAHVIEDSTRLYVYVKDHLIHSAPEVLSVDSDLDLAALKVGQTEIETLALAKDMPADGADVIAIGYPRITDILQMGFALHATVGSGTVSGLAQGRSRTSGSVAGFIQTTGILNFGNSGGPLVNTESGEAVGMVVTTVPYLERAKDKTGAAIASVTMKSGIGYSIPAPVIRRWLESQHLEARPSAYRTKSAPLGIEPEAGRSFATGYLLHTIANVFQRDVDLLRLAVQHYETAVALKKDGAWMTKNLGQAYAAMERWDDALSAYMKAFDQTPNDASLLSDIGLAWEHIGRHERAAESYRAAVRLDPRSAQARNNLGRILWEMGRLDDAISEFRRALFAQPGMAVAAYNLGLALETKGLREEAATVWEAYLQNPSSPADTLEWTKKIRTGLMRVRTAVNGRTPIPTLANSK